MSTSTIAQQLRRFDASQGPRKIAAGEGPVAELGGCDARFLVWGEESGRGTIRAKYWMGYKTEELLPYYGDTIDNSYMN